MTSPRICDFLGAFWFLASPFRVLKMTFKTEMTFCAIFCRALKSCQVTHSDGQLEPLIAELAMILPKATAVESLVDVFQWPIRRRIAKGASSTVLSAPDLPRYQSPRSTQYPSAPPPNGADARRMLNNTLPFVDSPCNFNAWKIIMLRDFFPMLEKFQY